MKKLIALLALSGCVTVPPAGCLGPATRDERGYHWCRTGDPAPIIRERVVADRQLFDYICRGATACAYRYPGWCQIVSFDEPLKRDGYIWRHEVRHCEGEDHETQ